MDVLTGLEPIRVCLGYELNGQKISHFPNFGLEQVRPIYETLEGWPSLRGIRKESELPKSAQFFIRRIENFVGVPISLLSTGPDRDEMIIRQKIFG